MLNWIKDQYYEAINSIAFYPTIFSILAIILSFVLISTSGNAVDAWLRDLIPLFQKSNTEASRTLLSVLITGMFTLTVFSFSMVMVVLNQAANNYSPKVLDGLLKDKRPQFILGFYVGGLLFCLPLLLNIADARESYSISVTGIVLALLCAITDLFLFIRFIHYISNSIKPAEISRSIYKKAYTRWKSRNHAQDEDYPDYITEPIEPTFSFTEVLANRSGYFQGVHEKKLFTLCKDKELVVKIRPRIGDYVLEGTPLVFIEGVKEDEKEAVYKALHHTFFFYNIEDIENNLFYGYRQLTEVAAKALSPGINDIGTARICIDFLFDLFSLFTEEPVRYGLADKDGKVRLIHNPMLLHDLFELCLDEIRLCGRDDKNVLYALIYGCGLLMKKCGDDPGMKKEIRCFTDKISEDLKSQKYLDDTDYLQGQMDRLVRPYFA